MIDHDKLNELANTLTEDQRRLLRKGIGGWRRRRPGETYRLAEAARQ
jgi:hypothetical protein